MTPEQVLTKARAFAARKQWLWSEPVKAESYRAWWVGPLRWRVVSNADKKGMNVFVEIDDATGEVLKANFIPR